MNLVVQDTDWVPIIRIVNKYHDAQQYLLTYARERPCPPVIIWPTPGYNFISQYYGIMVSGNRRKEYSAAAPATQTNNGQTYNMMMMLMSISKLQNDNCGYTECHSVQGTHAGAYNIMNEENSQNKIRSLKQKRKKIWTSNMHPNLHLYQARLCTRITRAPNYT